MGVVTTIWVFVGYSLAFSGDIGGIIGNLRLGGAARRRRDRRARGRRTSRPQAHFVFQEMFAIITPALITGAFADRVRFKSYLMVPGALEPAGLHPVGALDLGRRVPGAEGVLDFAGGMVVPRQRRLRGAGLGVRRRQAQASARARSGLPHNVAFVALGTGLLWFGWFGFNAGSALAANGVAAQAFVNTDIAGSIAMCTWLAITWGGTGKPSLVGAFTGAVAGLACVTPCAGYVPTWAAFVIGLAGGLGVLLRRDVPDRMKWDDALDVWAAHGVGGVMGTILLGVFALQSVNAAGADGLIAGNVEVLRPAGRGRGRRAPPTRSS